MARPDPVAEPAFGDSHGCGSFVVSERLGTPAYGLGVDEYLPKDGPLVESTPIRPPRFDEGPGSVLTPMGQVNSAGAFARGLGARRLKIALVIGGGSLLLLAIVAALQ